MVGEENASLLLLRRRCAGVSADACGQRRAQREGGGRRRRVPPAQWACAALEHSSTSAKCPLRISRVEMRVPQAHMHIGEYKGERLYASHLTVDGRLNIEMVSTLHCELITSY